MPRVGKRLLAVAIVAVLVGGVAGFALGSATESDPPIARAATPSASPSPLKLVKVGGVFMPERHDTLTPEMEPYPYTTPVPPREATPIDGTYVRIMSLEDVGGPLVGLPYRCLRCIPFRVDAGTSTLIFYEGRYFLHQYLSGFKALGHYTVDGDRIRLFNDPNCSSMSGLYRWRVERGNLGFTVINDPCAFKDERSRDLTIRPWVLVPACHRRIIGLWPGFLGC
jgi:hypothetical protein